MKHNQIFLDYQKIKLQNFQSKDNLLQYLFLKVSLQVLQPILITSKSILVKIMKQINKDCLLNLFGNIFL